MQTFAQKQSQPRPRSSVNPGKIQPKLRVNTPGDIYEQEADRMADRVMRMPDSQLHRTCPCGGGCPNCKAEQPGRVDPPVLRKGVHTSDAEDTLAPPIVHEVLHSPGQPFDSDARSFMEQRFGHDFSRVRVHTDARSSESAGAVNAVAYTVGQDIVFGAGQYAPATAKGKLLLAHELTHVTQQGTRMEPAVQRQTPLHSPHPIDPLNDPRMHNPGAPNAVTCAPPPHCPPTFCQPYSSASYATYQRTRMTPMLLGGIAAFVNSRVVGLWRDHLSGGTPPRDLTSQFGRDFTNSRTTANITGFLLASMRASLQTLPPNFPPGGGAVTEDFTTRLSAELMQIDDPSSPNAMDFSFPRDIAGNLAGGIGKDQTSCRAGAMPSPFNDERTAQVTAIITRNAQGDLLVRPSITFTVRDTIDLCPGNCGTSAEQIATVPISQFEATGISGDVPFTVRFAAPAALLQPFTVRSSTPPPLPRPPSP